MAGEQGYPWTVMQKTRIQDEEVDQTGPWIVAWRWKPGLPILVMSTRILAAIAATSNRDRDEGASATGLFMDAQQEAPFLFNTLASAVRLRDEVRKRAPKHQAWITSFECRVLTQAELDKWKIENALEQIASESGRGEST